MEGESALARERQNVGKITDHVTLSIVIPVFNEAESLDSLHRRLSRTLTEVGESYEIIFVDDGSTDGTERVLRELHKRDPAVTVIRFNRNYGQHAAVIAGFERAQGDVVVTLDADLQNPPEEIPKLLAKLQEGYDVVGGWREGRQDSGIRRMLSFFINQVTSLIVGVRMRDYGCMLRAYRRSVVESVCQCQEASSFIPALANAFAGSVAEIPVFHSPRSVGQSKYTPFRLMPAKFRSSDRFLASPDPGGEFCGNHYLFPGYCLRVVSRCSAIDDRS